MLKKQFSGTKKLDRVTKICQNQKKRGGQVSKVVQNGGPRRRYEIERETDVFCGVMFFFYSF